MEPRTAAGGYIIQRNVAPITAESNRWQRPPGESDAHRNRGLPILPEAGTSISASLLFAERIFAVSGTRGRRRAIDISGDGANNDGPPVEPVRQRLIAKGVTINGLVGNRLV